MTLQGKQKIVQDTGFFNAGQFNIFCLNLSVGFVHVLQDDIDEDMDAGDGASDSSSDDEHAWTTADKQKWKQHIKEQKMVQMYFNHCKNVLAITVIFFIRFNINIESYFEISDRTETIIASDKRIKKD